MIATSQQFSVLIEELTGATWTLAAIGLLFDSGLADQLRDARTLDELAGGCPGLSRERIARCLAVAAVRGVVAVDGDRYRLAPGALPSLESGPRTVLAGDYRTALLQAAAYLRATGDPASAGWRHTDPLILQAQGDGSSIFATALKNRLAPELGDLGERLTRPGARFLDVGVGVASLAIAMCRTFPALTTVGLDPYEVPLTLARANVAAAGLGDRVELRASTVEQLRDQAAFDLAWLPSFFLGHRAAVAEALARIRTALRPGGWVIIPGVNPAAGAAQLAVWSLVAESWGGPVLPASEIEAMIADAKLAPRTLPGPSWISIVAGQRPAQA
jgi:2-polyprenyl-3-methyl-5-hydroxy-6-metoxy-1,4-benzoquinol methylase